MKCECRLSDNPEIKEECGKEAIFSITFHNGATCRVCAEHNEMAKTIEKLITDRVDLSPQHMSIMPQVWQKVIGG